MAKAIRWAFVLGVSRFEILFESGALALLDDHTREAVSSFAVAVERFHEHWIKATLLDIGVAPAELVSTWKTVSVQSERQLGAFTFLHLRETGTAPKLMDQRWTTVRNEVIHKGRIPIRAEAIAYGEAVLHYMATLYRQLYANRYNGLTRLRDLEMSLPRTRAGDREVGVFGPATLFFHFAGPTVGLEEWPRDGGVGSPIAPAPKTFREALDHLEARREAARKYSQRPTIDRG